MGIKEDIEKLKATRESALAQKQRDILENQRREKEKRAREATERIRNQRINLANIRLGKEVVTEIFKPVLLEAMGVLNEGKTGGRTWSMVSLIGNISWTEYEPWNEYTGGGKELARHVITYDGIGLKRLGEREKKLFRKEFWGYPIESEYYQTYDILFAGRVGQSNGVFRLARADYENGLNLSFIRTRIPSNDVIIPNTSPEALNEDITQVRNPNSLLHSKLRSDSELSLLAAIRGLSDFQSLIL